MDRKNLQKQRNLMIISGMGIIAFAFWDIIEIVSHSIFGDSFLEGLLAALETEQESVFRIFVYAVLFGYYFVALLLKLYVGRAAIREGRGGKGGNFYVLLSIVLCVGSIRDILGLLMSFRLSYLPQRVMGLVVYLFLSFFLLQLIRSVYLVRKNSGKGRGVF